jgi:hypothetical protein
MIAIPASAGASRKIIVFPPLDRATRTAAALDTSPLLPNALNAAAVQSDDQPGQQLSVKLTRTAVRLRREVSAMGPRVGE